MVDLPNIQVFTRSITPRSGLRRLVAALAAGVVSLVALSPAAAQARPCPFAHSRIASASRGELRHAVVCLINQQRNERGLPGLRGNARLNTSAQRWTNVMVSHRYFSHGASFSARISAVGFEWSNAGENIAAGFETPASVVRAWMASPGHCANILNPLYREVGTGVSNGLTVDSPGTWTQDFGLRMGQHASSANWGPADGCPYR